MTGAFLIVSTDVGGSADPAAISALLVSKPERMVKARVLHLQVKPPVMTPTAHVEFVQDVTSRVIEKLGGFPPVRYVVDVSNNSSIALLLCQALPVNSLIGVRITGGEQHSAGLTPMMVGDVGGRATAIPVMNLARRQLLLDLGMAFSTKQLSLPLDDPEQAKGVAELKRQMSRASLKVTPSGKTVAVVQRSHDDLVISLGMGWCATRLPSPRDPRRANRHQPAPFTAAAWT